MQAKGTNIKAALAKWEQKSGEKVSACKEIKLDSLVPPIEKLDSAMSALAHVEKLSMSTNCIEKITNMTALKQLRVLSLGRNNIKTFAGLEVLAATLEELWISYNPIEKLVGIGVLKKLKVLYMSNNLVRDWLEFQRLGFLKCLLKFWKTNTKTELPNLDDLLFVGNPLEEKHSLDGSWRGEATKRLPNLKKLDGVPVVRMRQDDDEQVLKLLRSESKDQPS